MRVEAVCSKFQTRIFQSWWRSWSRKALLNNIHQQMWKRYTEIQKINLKSCHWQCQRLLKPFYNKLTRRYIEQFVMLVLYRNQDQFLATGFVGHIFDQPALSWSMLCGNSMVDQFSNDSQSHAKIFQRLACGKMETFVYPKVMRWHKYRRNWIHTLSPSEKYASVLDSETSCTICCICFESRCARRQEISLMRESAHLFEPV